MTSRSRPIDHAHAQYLADHTLGRLATVAPSGAPQNKPVGFSYNPDRGTIDIAGIEMERSAKFRNVAVRPEVAFVVDDVIGAGSDGVRFVEIRGTAEQLELDASPMTGVSRWIIRIHPRRIVSWNVSPDHPGLTTFDLADGAPARPLRPALGLPGPPAQRARDAVERQVHELQEGLDDLDADTYNLHFADDVMWGSPFGATVDGYGELHAIHVRLHQESRGGSSSRYEIVRVLAPTADVALAHVRRVALDDDGVPLPFESDEGAFSEMALYVLVRRGGRWWLVAGQNTIIRPGRGAKDAGASPRSR